MLTDVTHPTPSDMTQFFSTPPKYQWKILPKQTPLRIDFLKSPLENLIHGGMGDYFKIEWSNPPTPSPKKTWYF